MNPYVIDGPVLDERLFFGRAAVFDWVHTNLDAFPLRQLLVINGAARMGKSSALQQIARGRLGEKVTPVYVDLLQLSVDSLSLFYRSFAEMVVSTLQLAGVSFPKLEQPVFVNDPSAALTTYVLQPITAALDGRKLLFLLDNVTRFIDRVDDGYLHPNTLMDLDYVLRRLPQVYTLYALETSPVAVLSEQVAFLNEAQYYELLPFRPEVAAALVREPVPYMVVQEVANYIYELTAGHPYQLQVLCHALYERQVEYGLSQMTVADVALVYRRLRLRGGEWTTANALPLYAIDAPPPTLRALMRRDAVGGRRPRLAWLLLAVPFLLIVVALFVVASQQRAQVEAAAAVFAPTVVVEVTETAVFRETAVPTKTAVPTETAVPTMAAAATATATVTPTATPTPTPEPTTTPTASPTATVTATATFAAYPPEMTRAIDGMVMVYIPTGSFLMGSAPDDVSAGIDERPQHQVTLDHFYIDKYEVSVAQYAAFLNEWGGYDRACDDVDCVLPRERIGYTSYLLEQDLGDGATIFAAMTGFANYPINHVSWYGAATYCRYVGGRLPAEAEWEYAARGDDGRIYPWGNEPPDKTRAVFQSQSFEELKPVDALPAGASPFGVFGMAGSVWEWTADWYDESYYSQSPDVNPTGPAAGLTRAVRGGAWPNNNEADRIRAANRLSLAPTHISSTVGFRCAWTP
ncbi:MAG: SUMF1/EgtB/PvdO family nonheme iron enzyme [Anaerolinea sp.]|nr:SUMF1/EgtB/PvdO family nonheme iron enzyme [Anaerolinea sp.]